ncbi:MAG: hypothetical protein E5X48_13580 [Mesorhizobium sp.]|uniref:hypothetical protein n=1 Tax=Mesorhizobium sp. TaxID=1871066 RepID=UPI00121D26C6|nr:hypothetical protein [Mesorhizobium sp.]TIQ35399.1 MAG: hypothetical protein E5X48_13580 [Mesorhizobium sp.]
MGRQDVTVLAALPFFLVSCASHPVIDDVTYFTADDIAHKIRCETREAIAHEIGYWLSQPELIDDKYGHDIGPKLIEDYNYISNVDWSKLLPKDKEYIDFFMDTAIAYDFTLNMTEANNGSVDLNLFSPITRGTISLNVKTGADRTRNNVETFSNADTFRYLITDIDKIQPNYCNPRSERAGFFNSNPNYIYPISGKIGIEKMVDEFVTMSLFHGLKGEKTSAAPTMAHALEFTTKIYGNLTPKVVLNPPTVQDATFAFNNSREDKHKVIVGFSLKVQPQFEEPIPPNAGVFVDIRGNPTERAALAEIDRFISRNEVGRPIVNISGSQF